MTPTLAHPPKEVAIIGGGLAGLILALALDQVNIPCTVYEARPESHSHGGGFTLSPNALRALDSLGLYERLRSQAFGHDKLYFTNDKDETTDIFYFGSRAMYGYDALRIIRKDLLSELLAVLKERKIPVHFDSGLVTIQSDGSDGNRVQFTLTNGQTASASLVVGADGIHSRVRSILWPEVRTKYHGLLGISCVVPRSQMRIAEGYGLPATVIGKPGGFLLVPQTPDGSELYVGAALPFAELDEDGWKALRKDKQRLYDMSRDHLSEWPDVVQSALEAYTVDRMGFWAFYALPALKSWLSNSKRIILVGDAAHAMPPTVGQGANQAVEDVCALALLLAKLSPEVPLDKAAVLWQSYRQERIDKIMELTKQINAKRLPEAEKAKLPPGAVWTDASLTCGGAGELRWLYDVHLPAEVDEWVEEVKLEGSGCDPSAQI